MSVQAIRTPQKILDDKNPFRRSLFDHSVTRKERSAAVKKLFSGRFVVDIDETLAATATAWITSFAKEHGIKLPHSPHELFLRHGLIQNVPCLAQHPNLIPWVQAEAVTTNYERHRTIAPLEGALEALSALTTHFGGEIEYYLTARKPCMKEVTTEWLRHNQFPDAPIVFSPQGMSYADRNHWKAQLLRTRKFLRGIIDDQVHLADLVGKSYHGVVISVVRHSAALRTPRQLGKRHVRCSSWHTLASLAQLQLPVKE